MQENNEYDFTADYEYMNKRIDQFLESLTENEAAIVQKLVAKLVKEILENTNLDQIFDQDALIQDIMDKIYL